MDKIRGYNLDPREGLCVSDLTGNVVTREEFRNCALKFLGSVGVTRPSPEQRLMLEAFFRTITEDRWTAAHLEEATNWMVRNHKYPRASVADWYHAEVARVYPENWYKRQIAQGAHAADYECYLIDNMLCFKERDSNELPFKRVKYQDVKAQRADAILQQLEKNNPQWKT